MTVKREAIEGRDSLFARDAGRRFSEARISCGYCPPAGRDDAAVSHKNVLRFCERGSTMVTKSRKNANDRRAELCELRRRGLAEGDGARGTSVWLGGEGESVTRDVQRLNSGRA